MNLKYLPFLLILSLIPSSIELEMSAPSFLDIANYFHISSERVALTITVNLFSFSIAALAYGPLSDHFGRRKIMLIGNGILTLGAFACVIAPTIELLIVARFFQGFGAATSAVVISSIIADVYDQKRAAKLYALMNTAFSIIMALAPMVGGFINKAITWRGNYGSVAIICLLSWMLLFAFLLETHSQTTSLKSKFSFRLMLKQYKKLLTSFIFLCASSIPSLLYGCYLSFVALAPFLYMQTFQLTILDYTLHQTFILTAFAVTSLSFGKITQLINVKKLFCIALLLLNMGAGLMLNAGLPIYLTISMSLFSIGFAILYPIIFAYSLEIFPEFRGAASSIIMFMRYVICTGLTGIAAYFFNGTSFSLAVMILIIAAITTFLNLFLYRKLKF